MNKLNEKAFCSSAWEGIVECPKINSLNARSPLSGFSPKKADKRISMSRVFQLKACERLWPFDCKLSSSEAPNLFLLSTLFNAKTPRKFKSLVEKENLCCSQVVSDSKVILDGTRSTDWTSFKEIAPPMLSPCFLQPFRFVIHIFLRWALLFLSDCSILSVLIIRIKSWH